MTWPTDIVVSVSDYGTRELGSTTISYVFSSFLSVLLLNYLKLLE